MKIGIIGGTAMTNLATDSINFIRIDDVIAETNFGDVPMKCFVTEKCTLFFIERHHGDGTTPPHNINHKANIESLKQAGVEQILSVCSVGTIPEDFPPGSVGYASQYIDLTGQACTFFDDDAVFTSMTKPFDQITNKILDSVLSEQQPGLKLGRTYWLAQGPQFETPAEIDAIEKLGGEVVGMTMPRECKLSAELNLPYSALVVASNWAAGRDPSDSKKDLNHQDVASKAGENLGPVIACIEAIISRA